MDNYADITSKEYIHTRTYIYIYICVCVCVHACHVSIDRVRAAIDRTAGGEGGGGLGAQSEKWGRQSRMT